MDRTLKNIIKTFTALFLIIITLSLYICSYFIIFILPMPIDSLIKFKVSRNKNVSDVKIIDRDEIKFPFSDRSIAIYTKDNYKIYLFNVIGEHYDIYRINDIACDIDEFTDANNSYQNHKQSFVFGKLTGKKLDSISDIIDNREELYELYKFLEAKLSENNSKYVRKFTYNGIYTVKADFAKEGSEDFENIRRMYTYSY